MTPRDFALFDLLNCSAIAVEEDASGRPAIAEVAWLEANVAASGLFRPGSEGNRAAGVILEASRPGAPWPEDRAALWDALTAASDAALSVIDGRTGLLAATLPIAEAASLLEPGCADALTVILADRCGDPARIAYRGRHEARPS